MEAQSSKSRSVAIVAWQALPAVFPNLGSRVGGIETASWTFTKTLAAETNWQPTLVMRSPKKLSSTLVEGVQLELAVEPWEAIRRDVSECIDLGNRKLKRFRWSLLWKLPALAVSRPFRKRDPLLLQPDQRLTGLSPDVWVTMGVGKESAGVIATAKQQSRPSVLMIRSGADLDPRYNDSAITYSPYGERSDVCAFAIRNADKIICQTKTQQRILDSTFGLSSKLIRNPIDLDRWIPHSPPKRDGVLWIGRYEDFAKRISLAVEIAQACPDIRFTFIANRDDPAVEDQVRASCPKNVTLIDYVENEHMPKYFAEAKLFLSTSSGEIEGFPNVLLQAAATESPIVSLDDFDGFIQASGAGTVCNGDVDQAAGLVKDIARGDVGHDPTQATNYINTHHEQKRVVSQFAEFLDEIIEES